MDGGDEVSFGTALDHFAESAELSSLVESLPQTCGDQTTLEASQERFTVILDKYQEQPHLLDPYLESLISKLFALTQYQDAPPILMHQAFRYLYFISKVRGPKVIVRWFSHEVADLQPVLELLQAQDPRDHEAWETRYILLLWLSIIVIIPFDLCRMDGSAPRDGPWHSTIDRVMAVGKLYLLVTDKSRDAAALLLAKFISRPDVKKLKMAEFFDWALTVLNTADKITMNGMAAISGVLGTMASLFKHAKREDVVEFAPTVLRQLLSSELRSSDNTLLRKLSIKLSQRLGTTFLQTRVALWRYQRGNRSLEDTLATTTAPPTSSQPTVQAAQQNEEESYEVPEELEEVLGLLLAGLKDRDTVVRWSAAKGIGRITGRLPRELADDVVQSVLEFFSIREGDAAWHGGCLALAELGRRGLLLPARLKDVVPVVLKALVYDERRGSYSVGAHVRDAACYVCWSFARAYEPEQLKPYVNAIASGLVISALFDREVNCRRAASAAFQENVGRQGTFPYGISILTAADYFAVGNRSNVYLNVSVYVAQYPEYTQPLINHLVQHKLSHWDSTLRDLAAQALHNLTVRDPLYMREHVLPSLLPLVTTPDPSLRHGALLATAELSHALYLQAKAASSTLEEYLGQGMTEALVGLVPRLQQAKVFKGAVGEVMRPAALRFIERMCICELPVHGHPVIDAWQQIIDDNLPHTEESIREAAVSALSQLCLKYYCSDRDTIEKAQGKLLSRYTSELSNPLHFARMGFALALGALPKPLLQGRLSQVLDKLVEGVKNIAGCEPKYAEARRDAVRALTRICPTVGVASSGSCDHCICPDNVSTVFRALFAATRDYTTDSRGDIGVVVREAGMSGIEQLALLITNKDPELISPEITKEAICCLVQQSNEKIDRTRAVACSKLMTLIHSSLVVPHIPHHHELLQIFHKSVTSELNWAAPQSSFPLTIQLLRLPSYSYHTLLGVIVSVGGLTESTVRHSSASLLSYLKSVTGSSDTLDPFADTLLTLFRDHHKDTRVVLPLLKTLDLLLSNAVFDVYLTSEGHPFPGSLLTLVKDEIKKSRDAKKILASVNVFCDLLQFPAVRRSTLIQLMLLLCHAFPKVRKTTADQLYITLVTYDDILDAAVSDDVITVLSDTLWDGDITSVRDHRNRLCDLLRLPVPKLVAPTATAAAAKKSKTVDKLASYRDLVERAGY